MIFPRSENRWWHAWLPTTGGAPLLHAAIHGCTDTIRFFFFFFFYTRGEEGLHYSKSVDIMSLQLRHIFSLTLTIQHTRCIKKTVKNSRSEGLGDTFPPPLSTSPQTSSECPMASWTKGPLLTLPEAPAWNPQGAPQQLGTEDTQCSGCPGPS